jgi:uncharacterized protein
MKPNGNLNPEVRKWAMLCHLSSLAWIPIGFLVTWLIIFAYHIPLYLPIYIPGANILLPLMLWRIKKLQHPFIEQHGKESLNYQISTLMYIGIVTIIFTFLFFMTCGTSTKVNASTQVSNTPLLLYEIHALITMMMLFNFCNVIVASIRAFKGNFKNYPDTIKYFK